LTTILVGDASRISFTHRTARGISEVISRPKQDREPNNQKSTVNPVNQHSNPTMTTI
jgi:hypothetical protein